jgi:AcrR family transcriptional regulator
MRTAPTRSDRQAQTRAELIAAADRRFSVDGFHATTLALVADDAGYTKGAVYSNFSSKEDLFFAVYERRVERWIAGAAHVPEAEDVDAAGRGRPGAVGEGP